MWRILERLMHKEKPRKSSPEIVEATKTVYAAVDETRALIRRLADSDAQLVRARHQKRHHEPRG